MLIKLTPTSGSGSAYVNTEYIIEVLAYTNNVGSVVVLASPGHTAISLDVKETADEVYALCTPVTTNIKGAKKKVLALFGN